MSLNFEKAEAVSQHSREEGLCTLFFGRDQNFRWCAFFNDMAAVHKDHAVGDLFGKAYFVRHDDHRHAGFSQPLHDGKALRPRVPGQAQRSVRQRA